MGLQLGYSVGYWSSGPPEGALEAIIEAERLGFDSVWSAEAYGSDALTPLAWWGAATSSIRLGTGIVQISARTPAATAMAAMTMDHLSEGRFILGLGVSGPQVVEGWYGQPYRRPLERTREYISIVRSIFERAAPVEHAGSQYRLPYDGPDSSGLGKPLRSTIHPRRSDIPIFLGAEGPKNVALAAEIADGWLPLFFSPSEDSFYRSCLAEGFAASGESDKAARFEVSAPVPVIPGDDAEKCADMIRPMLALYAGGMGARGANFHFDVFARMGYEDVALKIQNLYLEGRKEEAAASIPLAMVEDVALVGPAAKIRDELAKWEDSCLTTILLSGPPALLPVLSDILS
ncbi:LLM class F420-dependent oxidoreductase [Ilumatobacteraceae bacterium]|nr:LLM class F420-dependent oxidoreductase [Ilumatobacteraceae bacterium]